MDIPILTLVSKMFRNDNLYFLLQKTEKTEFLSYFYKHCMHILVAPLLAATADGKVGKRELCMLVYTLIVNRTCLYMVPFRQDEVEIFMLRQKWEHAMGHATFSFNRK